MAAGTQFERIFIFGDSLSDPGNFYALTGETAKAPYEPIPSAPYNIGGFQFSNGKTWAQQFSMEMQLGGSGEAALTAPGKNGNYAFGGARARNTADSLAPAGAEQLKLYLADHDGQAHGNALYVMQLGGNDVLDAGKILQGDGDSRVTESIITAAATAIAGLVGELYQRGARHFLVLNLPDIGLSPALRLAGSEAVFITGLLVSSFNQRLDRQIMQLRALPGISVTRLDMHSILSAIADTPRAYGLSNTDSACLAFNVNNVTGFRKPDKYLFWDGIHPTRAVHKIISQHAVKLFR
jgi:phospholipase/lecithinase/hemolysin